MIETILWPNLLKRTGSNFFALKWVRKSIIVDILSYIFILLFIYGSLRKLLDPQMFIKEISHLPFLQTIGRFIVISICCVEILTAILISITRTRLIGLILALILT